MAGAAGLHLQVQSIVVGFFALVGQELHLLVLPQSEWSPLSSHPTDLHHLTQRRKDLYRSSRRGLPISLVVLQTAIQPTVCGHPISYPDPRAIAHCLVYPAMSSPFAAVPNHAGGGNGEQNRKQQCAGCDAWAHVPIARTKGINALELYLHDPAWLEVSTHYAFSIEDCFQIRIRRHRLHVVRNHVHVMG